MPVCLFDIDGTLIDAHGAGESAMRSVLAEHFDLAEITGHIDAAGRTDAAITTDLLNVHDIDLARLEEFRDRYLAQLPTALAENNGRVLPGVHAVLEHCQQLDGVSLGLLTGNFERAAWLKLEQYQLDAWFNFGAFGDTHVNRDDVARDAKRCLEHEQSVAVADEAIWIIGDTPADVRCARAIGAKAVAVATGVYSYDQLEPTEPDFLFASLEQAEPFLDALV